MTTATRPRTYRTCAIVGAMLVASGATLALASVQDLDDRLVKAAPWILALTLVAMVRPLYRLVYWFISLRVVEICLGALLVVALPFGLVAVVRAAWTGWGRLLGFAIDGAAPIGSPGIGAGVAMALFGAVAVVWCVAPATTGENALARRELKAISALAVGWAGILVGVVASGIA